MALSSQLHTDGIDVTARASFLAVLHHESGVCLTLSSERHIRTKYIVAVCVRTFYAHPYITSHQYITRRKLKHVSKASVSQK